MNVLTVRDVFCTEYEKFVKRVDKYKLEVNMDTMSNLELAGNLYDEMDGDIAAIEDYIDGVNKETKGQNKFRWYTILNIIRQANQPAAELFEHPCSLPGTLIAKICSQSKGAPISDEIADRYFNKNSTQHPINLQCYYSVEHNIKDKIYFLLRDLDKSPRKSPEEKKQSIDLAGEPEKEAESKSNEEESNNNSKTEAAAETTAEESTEE